MDFSGGAIWRSREAAGGKCDVTPSGDPDSLIGQKLATSVSNLSGKFLRLDCPRIGLELSVASTVGA
jgi:hypothetical protein